MSTFDDINQRFQEALRGIGVRDTERAVTKILISVQNQSAALTPIARTSNLVNSYYRKVEPSGSGYRGLLWNEATYARKVHESSGRLKGTPRPDINGQPQGNYWDPMGEPKFFEKGIEATIPLLPQILREEYSE